MLAINHIHSLCHPFCSQDPVAAADFTINITWEHQAWIQKRPGLDAFLQTVGQVHALSIPSLHTLFLYQLEVILKLTPLLQLFEVIVWTAAPKKASFFLFLAIASAFKTPPCTSTSMHCVHRVISLLPLPLMRMPLYLKTPHEHSRFTSQVTRCTCEPLVVILGGKMWLCGHVTLHTSRSEHSYFSFLSQHLSTFQEIASSHGFATFFRVSK